MIIYSRCPPFIDKMAVHKSAATDHSVNQMLEASDDKRPVFGNRYLSDPKNVFEHNAWDNVVWDGDQEAMAREKVAANSRTLLSDDQQEQYSTHADRYWDAFYAQHHNRFFKDRHWLFTEFPELAGRPAEVRRQIGGSDENRKEFGMVASAAAEGRGDGVSERVVDIPQPAACNEAATDVIDDSQTKRLPDAIAGFDDGQHKLTMLEVGCGVGNTVFPILETNSDPNLFIYCCDLSSTAIDIVKAHELYDARRCHAFVCDVSADDCHLPCDEASVDIIILIFVLSAIHPARRRLTVERLASYLRPGGRIIFRDYGRYDMAQLRFKDGKCLSDNCYVRGDGTLVYFSTQEEAQCLFLEAGLIEEQNLIDRRLLVNRGRQLKMYRVWLQCKYRKGDALDERDGREKTTRVVGGTEDNGKRGSADIPEGTCYM